MSIYSLRVILVTYMPYCLLLCLLAVTPGFSQPKPNSPYATKQGNVVYWAVTPDMTDTMFATLSATLHSVGIGFKPTVERNTRGMLTKLSGTIVPFNAGQAPPDTLLARGALWPDEQRV